MTSLFVRNTILSVLVLAAVPLRAAILERVIAKVNGEIITLSEFEQRQLLAVQTANVPREGIDAFLQKKSGDILQEAIDDLLLSQKADELGIKVQPAALDQVIEDIKKENKIASDEQFQSELTREGLTLEALRRNIARSICKRRVVAREIESKVIVGEGEIRAEYDRHPENYRLKANVHLQEIVLRGTDAKTTALAESIVERARAGEDFAALAKEHSTAPSAASGGDLGRVVMDEMSAPLRNAVSGVAVGGVTPPVAVGGTTRILKVNEREDARTISYDEARTGLEQRLRQERTTQRYDQYIAELRKDAVVDVRVREVPHAVSLPSEAGILRDSSQPVDEPDAPAVAK